MKWLCVGLCWIAANACSGVSRAICRWRCPGLIFYEGVAHQTASSPALSVYAFGEWPPKLDSLPYAVQLVRHPELEKSGLAFELRQLPTFSCYPLARLVDLDRDHDLDLLTGQGEIVP